MECPLFISFLSKFEQDDYIGILQSIDKVDDAVNYYLQEKL